MMNDDEDDDDVVVVDDDDGDVADDDVDVVGDHDDDFDAAATVVAGPGQKPGNSIYIYIHSYTLYIVLYTGYNIIRHSAIIYIYIMCTYAHICFFWHRHIFWAMFSGRPFSAWKPPDFFFFCCAEVASTSSKLKSVEAWSRVKSWIYPPQICVNHVVKGCLILRYKLLDDSVARKKSMRE